ncbi:MAG: AraC family transcriptional regulator [Clostridiales bacterium]|nr:AraC family transcriptional regulator [Clostridiales bacterium]
MDDKLRSAPPPYMTVSPPYKKKYHKDANYETSPITLNLFSVYQICELACASDHTVPVHSQICHEISYIVSGEGEFMRNGKSYKVYPNMVFLVNDEDVHSVKSSKDSPLRFMCLGFAFHKNHPDFPKYAHVNSFFENLKTPLIMDKNNLFNLFSLALSEVTQTDALASEMLESYVRQIIIQTYRDFTNVSKQRIDLVDVNDTNPLLYEISHYIDTNLTSITKLSDIADRFDYSYAYLSRIFSQTMGVTIRDYYSQRRLEKAAEMLSEDIPISVVSETLHFSDIPSFSKAFKAHYNMSPGKYQQSMLKNKQ